MTVSQVDGEAESLTDTVAPAGASTDPRLTPVADLADWQIAFHEGLTGEGGVDDDGAYVIACTGAGDVSLTASAPVPAPAHTIAIQATINASGPDAESGQTATIVAMLSGDQELPLGDLTVSGRQVVRATLPTGSHLTGLVARGLLHRESAELSVVNLSFETSGPLPSSAPAPSPYAEAPSMLPASNEDVTNSIEKDGISFILESRSLSAVVRYVYTPIEGNLSDIEVEINNADAIKLAEDGGITVFMEGKEWSASDEEIERHFVSCEQVGDAVEARWQFRRGSELADFLYRLRVSGKSLLVELEGGAGKAAGVDLGYVSGAIHPRLIKVPYFNLGDDQPAILSTSGVFISSLLDWYQSQASAMHGVADDDEAMHINGGCRYRGDADGRRPSLHDRWVLTVSRSFDEVLPSQPEAGGHRAGSLPTDQIWCRLPDMSPGEEAYIEAYERLRMYRQVGLEKLLVLHPESTWHDGAGGAPALDTVGAQAKGGDDAFREYLDAVRDMGYEYGLHASWRSITPDDSAWLTDHVALDGNGDFISTGPGRFLLKPSASVELAAASVDRLVDTYGASYIFVGDHAATPPWERVDSDERLANPGSYAATMRAETSLLAAVAAGRVPVVGDGGSHWLYRGLLHGYIAAIRGTKPADQPLLVDFALAQNANGQIDAGLGTPEQFFGTEIPADERDSRSPWLDRYLAATLAFGHAALLPDLEEWGLPAVAKTYYLMAKLQPLYLGVEVDSIHYQRGGNLLETTEALVAGAHELSQVRVVYRNGLQLHINGSAEEDWTIEIDEDTHYRLPPGSFLAQGPGDLVVYSADTGAGRVDYSACDEYLYCDTRGQRMTLGAMTLTGAAVLTHEDWVIDVYPLDCSEEIEIDAAQLWEGRRMPPLRVLAYRDEVDEPETLTASAGEGLVKIRPQDDVYRYRITLPEWMVEPGK